MGYLTLNVSGQGGSAAGAQSGGGAVGTAGDIVFGGSLDTGGGTGGISSNQTVGVILVTAAIIAGWYFARH